MLCKLDKSENLIQKGNPVPNENHHVWVKNLNLSEANHKPKQRNYKRTKLRLKLFVKSKNLSGLC